MLLQNSFINDNKQYNIINDNDDKYGDTTMFDGNNGDDFDNNQIMILSSSS